jgi:oligopeptidase A
MPFAEIVTDEALLAGLPDDAKEAARTAAEKAGVEGWRFSLQAPSYGPVMQYADNRELRARMYRAYATRAAEFNDGSSKPEWDNTPVMNRMLELRLRRCARCSASTTSPKFRWPPRWPTPGPGARFPA